MPGRADVISPFTDAGALRAAAAAAAQVADPVDRYAGRVAVFHRGFAGAALVPAQTRPLLFAALAETLADALEEEPREPVLLDSLGVALFQLGALDAADRLLAAALRLDPALPTTEANQRAVAARRGLGGRCLADAGLTARAAAIAAAARPAEGLRLSVCMIVRDEEEMLPRCLASVAGHVDEIVVVDTGSVDRTIEIAESFGARVVEQPWTGSFADARNRSFEEATGDWLLVLDADEVVVAEDAPLLREITGRTWREAFDVTEINFTGDLEDGTAVTHNTVRIVRNRPRYRWDGRLHEQIADKLPPLPERTEKLPLRLEHYGYLGEVRDAKEKSRRNIELLERQRAEGRETAFLHFNLGSEHGALGDAGRALEHFRASWRMVCAEHGPGRYGFTPSLVTRLVKALRVTGRLEEAIAQADEALELFPGLTDLVLEQGLCHRARGDEAAAAEHFARCLEMGDAPAGYTATVGSGTFLAGMALAESRRALGDAAGAEELLAALLDEHPSFLAPVLPLADLMLARGAAPAEVVAAVGEDLPPSARFMLGTALYEAGAVEPAAEQFLAVLERQPHSAPARVALAEALLSQARYAEAAAVAAAVDADSQWRPASLTTELVSRMLAGDHDGAADVLDAAGDRLAPGERPLLAACLAALAGEPLEDDLPPECSPLLLTILEALLRLQEVDVFAALVGLAERVGLSWRDAREALARMYLRRGYLESAADEWIEVCQRRPDARALVGLAQVAYARGLRDDARLFAVEARQLDPGDEGARRIIAALA